VGDAGINEDRVMGPYVYFSTVTGEYLDVTQIAQVTLGTGSKLGINIDRNDMAIGTYDFS
jgi:hypothetical protein